MNHITFRSLLEELESIEKNAGIKDVVKALGNTKNRIADKAKALTLKAGTHPKVRKMVEYATDPSNVADLSHSIANITSRLA
jgi:hypothetical protein